MDPCFNPTESDERQHLQHVIEKITAELIDYSKKVQSHHAEAREIVLDLQENKADMDHIEKASMRQSVNLMTRVTEHGAAQQQRLTRMVESPYFGRIDIREKNDDRPQPIYIGIHSFHDPNTEQQLVHDWRAPVSSMFYEHELGPAFYDAPSARVACDIIRKRQYRVENQTLQFMLETSLNIQDDILQKELSRASDDKMKNIVATIQRDQNAIIRNDESHTLIIQGAAGSGKTSIALHRIAFLLYRYKDTIRSQDILIISPNRVFAHYISQVLPELGEEMIQETTMEDIASRLLGHQVKYQSFAEQITQLLEHDDEAYALRVRFKASDDFLNLLDKYIRYVRVTNFTAQPVTIGMYTIDADWIDARFKQHRERPISDQITRVLNEIVAFMKSEYDKKIVNKDRTQARQELTRMFDCTTLKGLYKNFYDWIRKPEMYQPLKGGRYEYADVFPLIYLKRLVEALPTHPHIKHVVIDEMQDYIPIQYQILAQLYSCRKTILGDHHQAVSPDSSSSAEAIEQVLAQADCIYMHKSYRCTLEITELSQTIQPNPDLIPIERHGQRPALIANDSPADEVQAIRQQLERFQANDQFNTLGIICKTQSQADALYQELEHASLELHLLDARSTEFHHGIMIASAYLAKGLEFDQVILPHCDEVNYQNDMDRHMLYVGCTRAMHQLTLTCTGKPSRLLQPGLEQQQLIAVQA